MFSLAPVTTQGWAIGISAFILSIALGFLIFSGARDRKGFAMTLVVAASCVWAWAGFFYGLTENLEIARMTRVISSAAVMAMVATMTHFAFLFLEDMRALHTWERVFRNSIFAISGVIILAFMGDLFGYQTFVGILQGSPATTLAPDAGPYLWVVIAHNLFAIIGMAYPMSMRLRLDRDKASVGRRQARVFLFTFVLGTLFACVRWAPWYDVTFIPVVALFSVPMIIGGMFYLIKNYRMFNVQVLGAQLLIFSTWVFVFFRIILNPATLEAMAPDIGLLIALIVLGVFLMRSIIKELESRAAIEEIRRKEAVEHAKSEFLTIAAHQLRTPLSGVRWVFNLLQGGAQSFTAEQKDLIDKGAHRTDTLIGIVNDLLNVIAMQDNRFPYVFKSEDVRTMVADAAEVLEDHARSKRIKLSVETGSENIVIAHDANRLTFAVQNLIDNAVRYTKEGGSVAVRVEKTDRGARLVIRDTGIGFSTEEEQRSFERFFRGERARLMSPDGSGLGMSIAKKIVEDHGGTLMLESTEGVGTTVTIDLPAKQPTA